MSFIHYHKCKVSTCILSFSFQVLFISNNFKIILKMTTVSSVLTAATQVMHCVSERRKLHRKANAQIFILDLTIVIKARLAAVLQRVCGNSCDRIYLQTNPKNSLQTEKQHSKNQKPHFSLLHWVSLCSKAGKYLSCKIQSSPRWQQRYRPSQLTRKCQLFAIDLESTDFCSQYVVF